MHSIAMVISSMAVLIMMHMVATCVITASLPIHPNSIRLTGICISSICTDSNRCFDMTLDSSDGLSAGGCVMGVVVPAVLIGPALAGIVTM